MDSTKIASDRILLRHFKKDDLADFLEYCSQDGVGEAAGWAHHTSLQMSEQRLAKFVKDRDKFAIVLRENGKLIGHVGIYADSENCRADTKEMGYVLHRGYWNRGIMTHVVHMVLDMLFQNGIKRVYACCFQNNAASNHLIKKCGFILEKEGIYHAQELKKIFASFEYVHTKERWDIKKDMDKIT